MTGQNEAGGRGPAGFDFTLPGLGKPESTRPKRVAEAIKNELTLLLLQKVRDPRLREVIIVQVDVAPDLKRAKIYFTVPPGSEVARVSKGLAAARGYFRSHLASQLNLRFTPELVFYHDRHTEEAQRIDELLRSLAKESR
ncbi:MAG TPA: 30S ribosome-binding factor RbfA [Desulfobulbaceae bacterium]|jgi:ribosome-binding factor A|nr:30S ribosome-binding factor RbfA [Desulfobulbaceae bacterium]